MKEDFIKVVIKQPGKELKIGRIENELKAFQTLVDGYIETIRPIQQNSNIVAVLNDSGKINNLEPNFISNNSDIVVGNVVFTKSDDEGEFVSLTNKDLKYIKNFLEKWSVRQWLKIN